MEDMKRRGNVIFLTATALVLVTLSLNSPWLGLTQTLTVKDISGLPVVSNNHWGLHMDYYTVNSNPSSGYGQKNALASLMSLEQDVMLSWLVLGLAFLGLTLVNSRWLCIIVGLIMVGAMALAVAVFAMNVAGAVNDSNANGGLPWFPHLDNFFGSTNWYDIGVLSWGPTSGWFLALGAGVMQAVALLLGATRALSGRGLWKE